VSCREIADFLMDYLNGELPEAQRATFEEHLGECPDCVAYLQSYEMTIKLTKSVGEPEPRQPIDEAPEDLIRAILAARQIP
jgi:anti-sigma factor RsiW